MRRGLIVAVVVFSFITLLLPLSYGANLENLTISFYGESPQTRFGKPLLVAGRWQYVNITLDQQVNVLTLFLYEGDSPPAVYARNESNYYSWRYVSPDNWLPLHSYGVNEYINESLCSHSENSYSFYIGISQDAVPNSALRTNWTLRIDGDGREISSQTIVLEKPMTGIESTKGTLSFRVNPFTVANLSSTFGIHNIGNTPVRVTISYNKFAEIISTSNNGAILSTDETSFHNVTITTKRWPPGIIYIEGITRASSLYWFPYGTITGATHLDFNMPIIYIYVGRSNYEIIEVENNITFQYRKNITMHYGEKKDVTAYLCGNGNVTISLSSVNVTVFNVWYDGKKITNPVSFTVQSTNSTEHPLRVSIGANQPNCTGYIIYTLNIENHQHVYKTKIDIGAPVSEQSKGINSIIAVFVVVSLLTVVFYMVLGRFRYRR